MVIISAGIGYGTKGDLRGWAELSPGSIDDHRAALKRCGVAIRDVVGYVLYDRADPCDLAMMIQRSDIKQKDSNSLKGDIANLWPAGGKVEPFYTALADCGMASIEQAYMASGFIGEIDEFDGPHPVVLDVLNRAYGLPHDQVLTSPGGKELWVEGVPVRHFQRTQDGGMRQWIPSPTDCRADFCAYDPLTSIVMTYAMGIDPNDRRTDGTQVVTAVANVWLPASRAEIDDISGYVADSTVDDIVAMETVDLRTFGSANPTTISNMVATALYTRSFSELTGQECPVRFPTPRDIEGV